jgi:hypothetical protein
MRLVALLPSPGFRSLREQRDAASYAGAREANTEPVYEGPRAVSGNQVGTARLSVEVGMGRSVCSSALRRSTNERISHFSPRLLLLHRTACSLSDSIRQVQCGIVMCIEITNRLQIFHII